MHCPLEMIQNWKTLLATNLFPYWRTRSSGLLCHVAGWFLHDISEKCTAFLFRIISYVTDSLPWRWRWYIPLKHQEAIAQLHNAIPHKTQFLNSHTVKISKLCLCIHFCLFCLPHLLSLSYFFAHLEKHISKPTILKWRSSFRKFQLLVPILPFVQVISRTYH